MHLGPNAFGQMHLAKCILKCISQMHLVFQMHFKMHLGTPKCISNAFGNPNAFCQMHLAKCIWRLKCIWPNAFGNALLKCIWQNAFENAFLKCIWIQMHLDSNAFEPNAFGPNAFLPTAHLYIPGAF